MEAALAWVAGFAPLSDETVDLGAAPGRVLAGTIVAGVDVPAEDEAAWGGCAIPSAVTEGASEYAPIDLPYRPVLAGDAMPPGTDAVIEGAAVLQPVVAGHGVERAGSVLRPGMTALPGGTLLDGPALMLLTVLRMTRVTVRRQPRVGVMVPDAMLPLLRAAVARDGGVAEALPPYGADWARAGRYDAVLLTDPAGASWDIVGVAIEPGGSVALGRIGAVPCIRVPTPALDALAVCDVLVRPLLRRLAGRAEPVPISAVLEGKISSPIGVDHLVRVRHGGGRATPVRAPGLLQAVGANGWVLIPALSEGLDAGATVAVHG